LPPLAWPTQVYQRNQTQKNNSKSSFIYIKRADLAKDILRKESLWPWRQGGDRPSEPLMGEEEAWDKVV
jgi:hypothetical protein